MPTEHYGVAGHFTRYLVDTYGMDEHIDFVHAQASVRSIADLEAVFGDTPGESLPTVVDEYRAEYPLCSDRARTRHLIECAQSPVELDEEGRTRVEYDLSCDDPEVLGPVEGRMWRSFTLDVPSEARYRFINGISPFDFKLEVVDCDRGCIKDDDFFAESPGTIFVQPILLPGRYLVRLSREVEAPGRAGIDVTRVD